MVMATSSPRDHTADARQDLARKKARLSEDTGNSPSDSIVIELCEPDDGASNDNPIEILDDIALAMEPYSADFQLTADANPPAAQLARLQSELQQNCYIDPHRVSRLATSLTTHIDRSADDSTEWSHHYLDTETDFFTRVATLAVELLDGGELFEPTVELDVHYMRNVFHELLSGLGDLSRRIIPFLPDAMKTILSRRDSAQVSSRQQHTLGPLYYIMVAFRVAVKDTPTAVYWQSADRRLKLEQIVAGNRNRFCEAEVISALARVIKVLSGAMREVKDAWLIMHNALNLFSVIINEYQNFDEYPRAAVEEVLEAICTSILPTICEKHPRALPENFHNDVVTLGSRAIGTYVQVHDQELAYNLYERFVKGNSDAVIPESTGEESKSTLLWQMCGEDQNAIAQLLTTAWTMQARLAFITSEIMDIRTIGISALAASLAELYEKERFSAVRFDHPLIQYAVRFLRQNELTSYIFGPESRAGLVSHSSNIICFLAATSTYTNAETDIIWRACSTSVEADFVKASFLVLGTLLKFLDFERLLYLVKKYSTTSVDRLGADAIDFLPALLREAEERSSSLTDRVDRLSIAFTNMDILKHVNTSGWCPSTGTLRQIASNQIARLIHPSFALEDREEIYRACVPEIKQGTSYATTAIEVLSIFLSCPISQVESQHLVALLPPNEAVEEMCSFVDRNANCNASLMSISGAVSRLFCITKLMALANCVVDDGTEVRLFACAFGEAALCQEARSAAWEKLHTMAANEKPPSAAVRLWTSFMQDHVSSLSSSLATPRLIELILHYLKRERESEAIRSDFTKLLQLPLWNTLVRFAKTSEDNSVVSISTNSILELLFGLPVMTVFPRPAVAKCHADFARNHIKGLCSDYRQYTEVTDEIARTRFFQGIDLLSALLSKSRETAAAFIPTKPVDVLLLDNAQDGSEAIRFTAQIYGADIQCKSVTVTARASTKISELLSRLPPFTGAGENRIIAGGVEITQVLDKSLSEAGVWNEGVIMIRPKYSCELDLDRVLTSPGPVEQEILNESEALDVFLDERNESLAEKAFRFLRYIRLSAQSRARVTSPGATAQDLFPSDRPWRTLFSLCVLQNHVDEFVRLGVVDEAFLRRAVHLLSAFIVNGSEKRSVGMLFEMFRVLLRVFRELPATRPAAPYFVDAEQFVSATINWIIEAIAIQPFSSDTDHAYRKDLAVVAYQVLLLAGQKDDAVWKSFAQHANIVELHSQLLLDEDMSMSHEAAGIIGNICLDLDCLREVTDFYWRTISASIPQALQKGPISESYFKVAVDVANHNEVLKADESKVRELIQVLTSQLWSYKHIESPSLLVADRAMIGLLRLLGVAITILKSFKKPLLMKELPIRIHRELLFPSEEDGPCRPLVDEDTRAIALDLVRWSFECEGDYDELLTTTCETIRRAIQDPSARFPGHVEWVRPPTSGAGLKNLGMTCYMNSLLQQLFGNLQFRKFILDIPVKNRQKQTVLHHVQLLFAQMQCSTEPVADTCGLAQALDIQVGNQEDVHTFYTTLLSRLEEDIPDNATKTKLNSFFTGKSVTQVKGECGHVSTRSEPYTELSITVKNKASLHESLDEFVQGEPLEGANKYMCMTCASNEEGRLVNAMRRTCLEDVPDNLTFCLKRFTYEAMIEGENKVNDRFEFPKEIDMSLYKRSYLEDPTSPRDPDEFELVGVIVHQGSLQYGHYWSYVRVPNAPQPDKDGWLYLEDNKFSRCPGGIQEVQDQCFGGQKWSSGNERPDNAYVLCYQRKTYIREAASMLPQSKYSRLNPYILPRVEIPDSAITNKIVQHNLWRHRMASLFTKDFSSFVVWLLEQFPSVLKARKVEIDEEASSDTSEASGESRVGETEVHIGDLFSYYALRILMADPSSDFRVAPLMSSLTTILEKWPATALHILKHFYDDSYELEKAEGMRDAYAFSAIVWHRNSKSRSQLFYAVELCLRGVRERDPDTYTLIVPELIAKHASLTRENGTLDSSCGQWDEYLAFAANIARNGMFEAGLLLENGYLNWVFDAMYVRLDPGTRKRRQVLWSWAKTVQIELSSLYEFTFRLLNEHVDLTVDPADVARAGIQRHESSIGWCLSSEELSLLLKEKLNMGHNFSLLLFAGIKLCTDTSNWKNFAPGRLVGLFANPKVHEKWQPHMKELLCIQYDHEQNEMQPLLNMTVHYCANAGDIESTRLLLRALCKTLALWDGCEKKALFSLRQAHNFTPVAVVDGVIECAKHFLLAKSLMGRQVTKNFFQDFYFDPAPLSDNPALDAIRIRSTRYLVHQCKNELYQAYGAQVGRGRYEFMIETMENARQYLIQLHSDVLQRNSENGPALSPRILAEYDESRGTLQGLAKLLTELDEWEAETTLPTRLHRIQQSVEDESEEEVEMTDEDADADVDEDLNSNI